ncbi:MAG TPA: cobalamin-dependent protein, partial [Kineosporiaceae bacterium]|nr:cobalamin-dependent protein [Kineosporiaceae bacterium]
RPTPFPGPGPARPDAEDRPGRCGGGRVFALPDAPQARGLARAAMALDNHETARILNDAIRAGGVVEAWTRLAVPVLQAVGERWRATGEAVDVEHLFSQTLADVLRMVVARRHPPRQPSPVLLGCVEGDQHTLPLHALAAALAERGIGCRLLGGGMPPAALVTAVRRTGPALVFLYAGQPVEDASGLADLSRQRPAPRLLVGGPGWSASCPAGARLVGSLGEAVGAVAAVLRG